MAGRGTIKPQGGFNAQADAETLYQAMKGLGTNEDAILKLLTSRSNAQRQQIKTAFKNSRGKELESVLKSELDGKFETLIVALLAPPALYDAQCLKHAIKGIGTSEHVLIEILVSRTTSEIQEINRVYKQEFGNSLESAVGGDTAGAFKQMIIILLQASRQQGVQEALVQTDAKTLLDAGEKQFGTDEEQFVTILGTRSADHLRRVFAEYTKLSGFQIEDSIKKETSGSLKEVLLAMVKSAKSVPAYLAECLYNSMKGVGTDDQTLMRIMVSRSEIDMLDIRSEFRKMFSTSLHKMIQSETSGDYRKTLQLLCGGDDA